MIPKNTNPYTLLNHTTSVSRAALRDPEDDEDESIKADPGHVQMLARLESILKRTIDDVLPQTTIDPNAADSPSRKKKRRKLADDQEKIKEEVKEEPVTVCTFAAVCSTNDMHIQFQRSACSLGPRNRDLLSWHPKLHLFTCTPVLNLRLLGVLRPSF